MTTGQNLATASFCVGVWPGANPGYDHGAGLEGESSSSSWGGLGADQLLVKRAGLGRSNNVFCLKYGLKATKELVKLTNIILSLIHTGILISTAW